MRYRFQDIFKRRDGTSSVEFAIIAPVFIMMIMSMVGYSIYLSASSSIQQISEEAARAAIGGLTTQEREALAVNIVSAASKNRAFIDPNKVKVTVTASAVDPNRLQVSIQYDSSSLPIWSLYSFAMPGSAVISRTSVIRVGGV